MANLACFSYRGRFSLCSAAFRNTTSRNPRLEVEQLRYKPATTQMVVLQTEALFAWTQCWPLIWVLNTHLANALNLLLSFAKPVPNLSHSHTLLFSFSSLLSLTCSPPWPNPGLSLLDPNSQPPLAEHSATELPLTESCFFDSLKQALLNWKCQSVFLCFYIHNLRFYLPLVSVPQALGFQALSSPTQHTHSTTSINILSHQSTFSVTNEWVEYLSHFTR